MTMLKENSSIVFVTQQQQRLRLLKRLESCSIPSQYQGTELFTSTVLGGVEAPNSFAKMKGSSDMSSETHSEGEVILNSSASYSLGEVRKKIEFSRINSNAKDSSSSNANYNTKSIGEVSGPQ